MLMNFDAFDEDLKAFIREQYESVQSDKNEFAYWFDKAKSWGFRVPETRIVKLSFNAWMQSNSDGYNQDVVDLLNSELKAGLEGFNLDRKLFIKSGLFSNKFNFVDCYIENGLTEDLGKHLFEINYGAMCVGAGLSDVAVIREFIETDNKRQSIYNGMKLNTEFRVFYNFDTDKVVDIVNYWDTETMKNNLRDYGCETPNGPMVVRDRSIFCEECESIENEFNSLKGRLKEQIEEKKISGLEGLWSIDFMWTGKEFVLIDMALGKDSFYYKKEYEL
jgi:hypothetical protein